MKKIPESKWEWFGNAGHFMCSQWCRFHLCTKVGPWLVSTVGEYVHPRHSAGGEQPEAAMAKCINLGNDSERPEPPGFTAEEIEAITHKGD